MNVVIQCAAKKQPHSGYLRAGDGRPVMFVANPDTAPASNEYVWARPDEDAGAGPTWRQMLVAYNDDPSDNPLHLLPAYQLYGNDAYRVLVASFGADHVYILSAGWGLIPADFLTPKYDITFSASAESYKRRRKNDCYDDFRLLADHVQEPMVFFGGKDYLPLFCELTRQYAGKRKAFYNSSVTPTAIGVELVRYHTRTRTNWHYECARAFLAT